MSNPNFQGPTLMLRFQKLNTSLFCPRRKQITSDPYRLRNAIGDLKQQIQRAHLLPEVTVRTYVCSVLLKSVALCNNRQDKGVYQMSEMAPWLASCGVPQRLGWLRGPETPHSPTV